MSCNYLRIHNHGHQCSFTSNFTCLAYIEGSPLYVYPDFINTFYNPGQILTSVGPFHCHNSTHTCDNVALGLIISISLFVFLIFIYYFTHLIYNIKAQRRHDCSLACKERQCLHVTTLSGLPTNKL